MPKPQKSDSLLPLLAGIFLISPAPFWPALHNGFVNWDDAANLLENTHYRGLGWTQLRWMFTSLFPPPYQPLSWLTFGADYCLWGLDPMGYHLTNLVLHAANAVVFFFISARLLAAARDTETNAAGVRLAAALSALLFAVHPLRVESVAWATERRDVLSGFFYLLTILSYLRLGREPASPRRLAAPLVLYLLSLFAKGMGITLPLVLIILDVYPLRRLSGAPREWLGPKARALLWEKVPFFALAVAFAVVGVVSQSQSGAVASLGAVGPAARLVQSLYGLAFYAWKTLIPTGLSPLYLRPVPFVPTTPAFLAGAAFVCVLTIGAIRARRRWPALPTAGAYYTVTLLPVLGLVPLGVQLVADRYSYLACLVWPLLIAGAIADLPARPRRIAFWGGAGVLVLLGTMTWRQTLVWRDSTRLWRHALSIDATNSVAHRNLAIALLGDGRQAEAIDECEKALRISPSYADGHAFLAQILLTQGRFQEAAEHYSAVLRAKPDDASAHYNLGLALYKQGRWQEAIPHYRRVVEIDPQRIDARVNLGAALTTGNQWSQAIDVYREALRLAPDNANAHNSLGVALAATGRIEEGLAQIEQAVALSPSDPEIAKNRAWLAGYLRKRRTIPRP
ncbi:MAG: hypothetical protein A2506_01410 [Elusimicrobia bacterium RIFOXYD12_FULL_66_9]|nr:MAG: hypothetical protein A2506_01410 [Elusimicrobia bacterium RIFOXYD12_FULL_66_9]